MKKFGQVMRERRRELGMTLDEVGKKVGTGKGYLCSIERGLCGPPAVAFVKKICRVLRLDLNSMLIRAHAQKSPKEVRPFFEHVAGGAVG